MKTLPTRINKTRRLATTLALAALATLNACLSTAHAQGSLTPTGAPGMIMKSLAQIEPRTDIMTVPGDISNLHIITNPGAYYLTTNLTLALGKYGISVRADNVSIDLNGFAVIGVPSSVSGIIVPNTQTNLVVRNGTITGTAFYGIDADALYFGVFEDLVVTKNLYIGIDSGRYSTVRDCIKATNGGEGILAKGRSVVVNCTSVRNLIGVRANETITKLDGNHLIENGIGLQVDSSGSLIIRNDATGNGTNYLIAGNNKVGVIASAPSSSAISGSSGGSGVGTTDPWGNISF